jgi:hypothetical protein
VSLEDRKRLRGLVLERVPIQVTTSKAGCKRTFT